MRCQALGRSPILDDQGNSQLVQFPNVVTKHLKARRRLRALGEANYRPDPVSANKSTKVRASPMEKCPHSSQMNQRAASMGMSVLLTSAIELEAHQIEVVRRVLQIPSSDICSLTK